MEPRRAAPAGRVRRTRPRSALVALACVAVAAVLAVDGGVLAWTRPVASTPASDAPSPARRAATPARASALDPGSALGGLLERRGAAVRRHDRAAWLATVDARAPAFRASQAQLFSRLQALRPATWVYRLVDSAALPARRRAVVGAQAVLLEVTLAYRLAADTRDVHRTQHLTVIRRGGRWVVAADSDGPTERDLWDLGPVRVARGSRSVVVGATSRAATLPRLARDADTAAARVDRVWGRGWPRRVVVVVPRDLAQLATLLGRRTSAGLDQVAALTSGEVQRGGPTPGGVADRVLLNPVAFAAFGSLGRRVVLAHEFTHVATRSAAVVGPPLWVEEGFADYVGYLDSGLPRSLVAADLLRRVRQGRGPAHLPTPREFDPVHGRIAPAYGGAWLAMQLLAREGGTARVVDFYRVSAGLPRRGAARAPGTTAPSSVVALAQAFSRVAGGSRATFERRWRAYLATASTG